MTYQGYENYETWCISLWMSNDESLYDDIVRLAKECQGKDELGQAIESYIEELRESSGIQFDGMWGDLMNHALGMVAWHDVAGGFEEYLAQEENSDESEDESED